MNLASRLFSFPRTSRQDTRTFTVDARDADTSARLTALEVAARAIDDDQLRTVRSMRLAREAGGAR